MVASFGGVPSLLFLRDFSSNVGKKEKKKLQEEDVKNEINAGHYKLMMIPIFRDGSCS